MPAGATCCSRSSAASSSDRRRFRYSAAMLREYGNLSSAFVYFVLEAALADDAPRRLVVAVLVRRRLQLPWRAARGGLTPRRRCRRMTCRASLPPRRSTRCRRTIRRRSARAATCVACNASWARAASCGARCEGRSFRRADGARPLRVLELGAGDGTLAARRRAPASRGAWPPVALTLLDRQRLVERATLDGYARSAGPRASRSPTCSTGPRAHADGSRWDLIVANLFLHHFDGRGSRAARRDRRARRPLLCLRAAPRAPRARRAAIWSARSAATPSRARTRC